MEDIIQNNPGYDFCNYLINKYPGKVVGVADMGVDCRIDFTDTASIDDQDIINSERATFDFTVVEIDYGSFKDGILLSTFSRVIKVNMAAQFPVWEANLLSNPSSCKADWVEMKSEGWLTSDSINSIEALASQYSVPII